MRPVPWHLPCAGALLAIAAPARAGGPATEGADISWSAPPECPTAEDMRAAIERLVRRSARAPRGPRIPVRMEVSRSDRGAWTARIEVEMPGDEAPHTRRIEGGSCAEVADAAAVVTALAIAPAIDAQAIAPPAIDPPDPPLRAAAPDPVNAGSPLDPDRADPPPRPPIHLRPAIRGFASVDFASLPTPAPGAGIAAAILFGAHRLEIIGAGWAPERATTKEKTTAGGDLSLITGAARYCRSFFAPGFTLAGCAGLEAGAMRGTGFGVRKPGRGTSPWIAPGVGALALWDFSRTFSASLALDSLVPVVRSPFVLDGIGYVHRPPVITGRAFLGVEAHFR